ncbi:ArnT family glycosyltransferase [Prauserella flavalba]|uniref:Glycosyltransferase n=1 Tax=Prauserella flavalba TaxID=1477506 RepID=A0A318LL16_9PSEU|nr:glycosyltransferase family 39 protein [Prauserella flavalba]PXY24435.1 glycosyltransferase [Prauserella flavalba]
MVGQGTAHAPRAGAPASVPAFARVPVLAVAGAAMAVLLAFSGRHGYHGDELYFIAAGRHLDWGYADQPPLLPLLALLTDTLFPSSVMGFRLPAILLTGLGVVIAALIARELGGGARAQLMAAGAYACSPFLLAGAGHILATHMVDAVLWTVICWLVVRWVRVRDDRLLFAAALVTAVDLQVKFLIPVFWVLVTVSALVLGPRDLPRRPLLLAGGVLAVVACVPTLAWQAAHGWPQLEMNAIVASEVAFAGGRATFLPMALEQAGIGVGALALVLGVWWLLRSPRLRPYRFLGPAVLGVTAVFWFTAGRPYYVGGLFALCFAVAAVELDRVLVPRWRPVVVLAYVLSAVVAVSWLPVRPVSDYAGTPYSPMNMALEEFGWEGVARSVAAAYTSLPQGEQARTTVVTETYWQAAAIEKFAPELPEPHSGSRGYWYFGAPPEHAVDAVFVGSTRQRLLGYFAGVRRVGEVDNGHDINNVTQGEPIWLCEGRVAPWPELWPRFRHMSFTW